MSETQIAPWWKLIVMRWVEPQLRRTERLLKQANDQLGKALEENIRLKSRNDELARQLEVLEQDNKDLHRQIDWR